MEFQDLLSLYFERSNAMQTYWNFYITVNLALLAFMATVQTAKLNRPVAVILMIAFAAFASVNGEALSEVAKQRTTTKNLMESFRDQLGEDTPDKEVARQILAVIHPPTVFQVIVVHLIGDIFVLGVIWFFAVKRMKFTNHRG